MEIKQEIDSEKVMDEEETKMSEQKEDIKVEQVSKTESKNEILQPKKETTNNTSSASKNEEKTKTNAIKNNSIKQRQFLEILSTKTTIIQKHGECWLR